MSKPMAPPSQHCGLDSRYYMSLFYFNAIARYGSLSGASRKLLLGEPALSLQLKRLETVLGEKLFERVNRRLILNDAGKLVLEYSQAIFQMGDELSELMKKRLDGHPSKLRIGVLDHISDQHIADLIQSIHLNECISVAVMQGKREQLFNELQSYRIDILVTDYPPALDSSLGFSYRRIARMPVFIWGAPTYSHLKKNFPDSLNGQHFILPEPETALRCDLERYFKLSHIRVNVVAEIGNADLRKVMAVRGLGLTVLAKPVAEKNLIGKKIINLGTLRGVYRELWLVCSARFSKNDSISKLFSNRLH